MLEGERPFSARLVNSGNPGFPSRFPESAALPKETLEKIKNPRRRAAGYFFL
jgi:hypothetical protein